MKRIDDQLWIESEDIRKAGIDENTAITGKARGSRIWQGMNDPDCKSKNLYLYEAMADKYKKMLTDQFGDPYQYVVTQPIKQLVVRDFEAHKFFLTYKYNGNKSLPAETVEQYTVAASWLNMLLKYKDDKKYIKKVLNVSLADFYIKVGEIFKGENIDLPTSYKRMRENMDAYKTEGYQFLIHSSFGNTSAVKVNDEVSESVLLEMIAHPNQFDDVYICWQYNIWAQANDRKPIVKETVGNYRRRNYDKLIMQREGNEKYVNTYGKSVIGYRPTQPTFLWESDDNHSDFYFTDWDDKTSHKFYYTFKGVFVTDAYNDLVLGYAYGKEITVDLVFQAYRNAMHYVKGLTGNWMLPHETKTDRWALKKLLPFYNSIGNYAPTPKGSKKRGYLEQFFGSSHWQRCMKIGVNNYTGHNITAKTSGVNREVLHANRHNFPSVEDAPQFFADMVNRLRLMPQGEGQPSKQQEWLNAYKAMPEDKKKVIIDEDYLLKFGIEKPQPNQITDKGIQLQIDNRRFTYDIPDEYYYSLKGSTLFTYYDPADMNRVLFTDKKSIRFTAAAPVLQPRAMADYQPGDRTRLNTAIDGKKKHVEGIVAAMESRQLTVTKAGISIEKLLTEGMLLKEERILAVEDTQRRQLDYHDTPPPPPQNRRQSSIDKM